MQKIEGRTRRDTAVKKCRSLKTVNFRDSQSYGHGWRNGETGRSVPHFFKGSKIQGTSLFYWIFTFSFQIASSSKFCRVSDLVDKTSLTWYKHVWNKLMNRPSAVRSLGMVVCAVRRLLRFSVWGSKFLTSHLLIQRLMRLMRQSRNWFNFAASAASCWSLVDVLGLAVSAL